METYLITAVIVVIAMATGGYIGYFSGFDAGRREANARHRSATRHPSGPSNLRLVDPDESA